MISTYFANVSIMKIGLAQEIFEYYWKSASDHTLTENSMYFLLPHFFKIIYNIRVNTKKIFGPGITQIINNFVCFHRITIGNMNNELFLEFYFMYIVIEIIFFETNDVFYETFN